MPPSVLCDTVQRNLGLYRTETGFQGYQPDVDWIVVRERAAIVPVLIAILTLASRLSDNSGC